jgi:DNA gyrase subunit A
VFQSRGSQGVRGISLEAGERAISMTILASGETDTGKRAMYLKRSTAERRAASGEEEEEVALVNEDIDETSELTDEDYERMRAGEQFVLTVTEFGYGKRSSSYDFRRTNRGGKGIRATDVSKVDEIGTLVAAFPVVDSDEIMLVTDGGKVIRSPVHGANPKNRIRIASRTSKGVKLFDTAEGEKVVSVERISEPDGAEDVTPPAEDTQRNGE